MLRMESPDCDKYQMESRVITGVREKTFPDLSIRGARIRKNTHAVTFAFIETIFSFIDTTFRILFYFFISSFSHRLVSPWKFLAQRDFPRAHRAFSSCVHAMRSTQRRERDSSVFLRVASNNIRDINDKRAYQPVELRYRRSVARYRRTSFINFRGRALRSWQNKQPRYRLPIDIWTESFEPGLP